MDLYFKFVQILQGSLLLLLEGWDILSFVFRRHIENDISFCTWLIVYAEPIDFSFENVIRFSPFSNLHEQVGVQ